MEARNNTETGSQNGSIMDYITLKYQISRTLSIVNSKKPAIFIFKTNKKKCNKFNKVSKGEETWL